MANKFMDPHDVPQIPGTEGWEKMYPYQYTFTKDDPERAAYESSQIWYYDGLHYPIPHYPFDLIWDEAWYLALSQYNTRHWLIPPAMGIDHRIVNGYVYISPVAVANPDDIPKRVPHFMERAGYYFQNWNDLYENNWKKKMNKVIEDLSAMNFTDLPEMEDISVIKNGMGKGSGYELLKKYDKLIDLGLECWQYHFEFLNLAYAVQVTFFQTMDQLFPGIPMATLTKMSAGFDPVLFKPDAELIRLAKLAVETGCDELIMKPMKADELMKALSEDANGKKWLEEFEKARYPWFHISSGTGWFHTDISWNDNLNIPFENIRTNIKAIKAGKVLGRPTDQILKERDRIADEYRNLLKTDADKEAFDQGLNLARLVLPYAEDHNFYVEHWFHTLFWAKVRQVGQILSNAGFFGSADDVWFLKRDEIKQALWDLITAWATGVKPRGPSYWPKEIDWRKGVYEKLKEWTPPSALGTPPDVVTEPFTIVLWGVTSNVLQTWLKGGEEGGGDPNVIQGSPGSSGVAEGKARVLKNVDQLIDLKDGEILVATTTSPSWAPAFVKIAGAVTDVGGPMCHAAIVCREYGLPTVVGTGKGTQLIKTGDLIRMDGDTGKVTILQRA
ncbi:MAG: PEP-utilizing enzyme [Syntrophorhabdus sp.]|jgi:pyruvate,water dikinase